MSDSRITRETYKQYAHKIVSVLKNEEFYEQFKKRVDKGSSVFKLAKKRLIQDISIDWIDTIEEVLPNLDTIVRNPRKFIVQEEDIVDVSLARSISTESVKFLAQHTNMISKVDEDGSVTPSKILNITKEESFEIYENRFIYTLLLKLKDFVTMRYDKIKKASATQDVLELDIESRFNLPSKKVTFRTEYFAQLSFDEVMRLDPDTLTKIERIAKIDRIITDFLSSSFAKSMRNSAPVRPPIMRTNVILKEPNFKKALTLWQFIETYNVTAGFSTSDEVENYDIEDESEANLKNMVTLNTMLFESIYDQSETDMDMEDKEFADFLRVGDMDFQKDEISRDEYAQKLDEEERNDEEEENVEEVAPKETEEAEQETETPKEPQEQEKTEEQPEPEKQEEKQPEVEEVEKEVEKEIVTEMVEEVPVAVEIYKELVPKADQEEVDLEPDAEKFDQHLYEVRKLYKRPDDDKLKQEDIAKVKDAIDRCLTSYRRIKQEEIDDRERRERIRRRKEDMEKRAEAFRKLRAGLEGEIDSTFNTSVHYGIDPFSYQRAKIAALKKEEEQTAERLARIAEIKRLSEEKLLLEDRNSSEEISKSIEDMEREKEERLKRAEKVEKVVSEIENVSENVDDSVMMLKPVIEDSPNKSTAKKSGGTGAKQAATDDSAKKKNSQSSADKPATKKKQSASKPSENKTVKANEATQAEVVKSAPNPRKPKNIPLTDENKVAVGGLRIADTNTVDDPYGTKIVFGKPNKDVETEPKETKPRKPRAKKAPETSSVGETSVKDESVTVQEAPAVITTEEKVDD